MVDIVQNNKTAMQEQYGGCYATGSRQALCQLDRFPDRSLHQQLYIESASPVVCLKQSESQTPLPQTAHQNFYLMVDVMLLWTSIHDYVFMFVG